jgi:hypothetical protein
MKKLSALVMFVMLLVSFSLPSQAGVVWKLNDMTFSGGAQATGQFEWDGATNTVLNWQINVLPTFSGSVGSYSNVLSGDAFNLTAYETLIFRQGAWDFRIGLVDLDLLDNPLSFLGLKDNVFVGGTGYIECSNCGNTRYGSNANAYLSAVTVPESSGFALLVVGLLGLVMQRRRKTLLHK